MNEIPSIINPIQNSLLIVLLGICNYLLLKNLIVDIIPALSKIINPAKTYDNNSLSS